LTAHLSRAGGQSGQIEDRYENALVELLNQEAVGIARSTMAASLTLVTFRTNAVDVGKQMTSAAYRVIQC
jgi:hypothetical protein